MRRVSVVARFQRISDLRRKLLRITLCLGKALDFANKLIALSLEEIDDEAGKLFARTRNQSKKFYEALSRYETAEKAARTHLLSRDTYEDARKDADGAKRAADALRAERETLRATIYKLERLSGLGRTCDSAISLLAKSRALQGRWVIRRSFRRRSETR